jgi:hypothetical protein
LVAFCLSICLAVALTSGAGTVYDFTMNSIESNPVPLAGFKGKVTLAIAG